MRGVWSADRREGCIRRWLGHVGTVSSWVLRMEASQYVFVSAYNVVVFFCSLLYVFISAYNVVNYIFDSV